MSSTLNCGLGGYPSLITEKYTPILACGASSTNARHGLVPMMVVEVKERALVRNTTNWERDVTQLGSRLLEGILGPQAYFYRDPPLASEQSWPSVMVVGQNRRLPS